MAKAYVTKYDANADGELSYAESEKMLSELSVTLSTVALSMLPADLTREDTERLMDEIMRGREGTECMFRAFDKNGDKALTREEL